MQKGSHVPETDEYPGRFCLLGLFFIGEKHPKNNNQRKDLGNIPGQGELIQYE
jgi:hypothetical protein